MAIDLRDVAPLGSKSVLLEQAMRRQLGRNGGSANGRGDDMDMSDMVTPDFAWLNEDKTALKNLVAQMDASIGQLAQQMRELDERSSKSRNQVEKEQQLLFKQIKTLNGLLKKQIDLFSSMERQMSDIEVRNRSVIPQVGIALVAGLMSAVTILVSAPWMSVFLQRLG
jgi:predicted  nucleic acid-binding Zn-ribbon protein